MNNYNIYVLTLWINIEDCYGEIISGEVPK